MDEEFLAKISGLDWDLLGIKLKAVALFWIEHTFKDPYARLPKGFTIDDVVQDAIQRSFKREWEGEFNDSKYLNYLFGAIRSIVSNLAKSSDNKTTDRLFFKSENEEDGVNLSIEDIASINEDFDFYMDYESTMAVLDEQIKGNDDLEQVLTAIKLGLEPREIAKELKKDVKEIYRLKRQLFSAVEKIAKTL